MDLDNLKLVELKAKAKEIGLSGYSKLKKEDLIQFIKQKSVAYSKSLPKKQKLSSSPSSSSFASSSALPKRSSPRSSPSSSPGSSPRSSPKKEVPLMKIPNFSEMKVVDLKTKAKEMGISNYSKLNKQGLITILEDTMRKTMTSTQRLKGKKELQKPTEEKKKERASIVSVEPKKITEQKKEEVKKAAVSKIRVIDEIGSSSQPKKYGLISEIGKGQFGAVYKAVNLKPTEGEEEFYAVKILIPEGEVKMEWEKEVKCLREVYQVCKDAGILCYKDSFVSLPSKLFKEPQFVIVTPFLENYIPLQEYILIKTKKQGEYKYKSIPRNVAEKIYADVIYAKNAMTDLCIHHGDLHLKNIMIHPETLDIKIIDLGRCMTPEEEENRWLHRPDIRNVHIDRARLKDLRETLANDVFETKGEEVVNKFVKYLDKKYPIKDYIPGCKRKNV